MHSSSGRFLVGLTLAGLLLTALPSSAQKEGFEEPDPTKGGGLLVTYLVYSGLDNPTLTLTDPEQVADLQRRLTSAVETGARVDSEGPEPVLGYNGIMIEELATAEDEDSTFYVVKDDTLRVDGGNPEDSAARSTTVAGEAAEIENLLIALGIQAGAIDEATLSEVRDPK